MLKKKTLGQAVRYAIYGALTASFLPLAAKAADVAVDVNVNMKHSVVHEGKEYNQLDRSRRFAVHARSLEPGWDGELAKMDYLMNDLDVYFARDTGQVTFMAQFVKGDQDAPLRSSLGHPIPYGNMPMVHDKKHLAEVADFWKTVDLKTTEADKVPFMDRAEHMIMGAQPQHFLPNWSFYSFFNNGSFLNKPWRPHTNEQATDWAVDYVDAFFSENTPQLMPEYWEVVNEPDMEMFDAGGEALVMPWDQLFELHNDVANAMRQRFPDPNNRPKVGGMTWGLHDFNRGDTNANGNKPSFLTFFEGHAGTGEQSLAIFDHIVQSGIFGGDQYADNRDTPWYQWDQVWAPFLDVAGQNMDFISIHLYDWPSWRPASSNQEVVRSGNHVEAVLDILEWNMNHKLSGPRKEVIVSEYGAVSGGYADMDARDVDFDRRDWENLMPFSQMLMQFLERPDFISTSLPFTPIKAEVWGADFGPYKPYPYTMMDRNYDTCTERTGVALGNGVQGSQALDCGEWEWSEWIKWYELWSGVDGTRVDTYTSDRDIQVDAYQQDNKMHVIINSLHTEPTSIDLNLNGGGSIESVRLRHLYLDETLPPEGKPVLADATTTNYVPSNVTVGAGSTVILDVTYSSDLSLTQTNTEQKFMLSPLSDAPPHRAPADGAVSTTVTLSAGDIPQIGEAQARFSGAYIRDRLTGATELNVLSLNVNGTDVAIDRDLRGEFLGDARGQQMMGTFEIPFDVSLLRPGTNTITMNTAAGGQHAAASLQIWDLSASVDRSKPNAGNAPSTVSLSGASSVNIGQSVWINPGISASADASAITWEASPSTVASVDANGVVTGRSAGSVTITASAGGSSDSITLQVAPAAVESITVKSHEEIYAGFDTSIYARVYPVQANQNVTWESLDTSIADIDDKGFVTSYKSGQVTFRATSKDDPSISGEKAVTILGVTAESMELVKVGRLAPLGSEIPLITTIKPFLTSDRTITWTSSNNNIAVVSEDGVVSGVMPGVVTITATSNSNPSLVDTVTLEVVQPGEPVKIEAESPSVVNNGFDFDPNSQFILGFNQAGDSLAFDIDFKEEGIYFISMRSSSPVVSEALLYVDDVLTDITSVVNTGAYDVFSDTVITADLKIDGPGIKTLRIASDGASQFLWNVDYFEITRLASLSQGEPQSSAASSSSTPVTVSSSSSESSSSVPSSSSVVSSSVASSSITSSSVISSVASSSEVASSSVVVIASSSSSAAISSSSVATSSSLVSSSSAPVVVSSSSASSSSEPITPATEITVSQVATNASDIVLGSQDVEVLKFDMQSNVDGAMLKALTIKASGEMDDVSALSNVTLLYGNTILQNANYSVDNGMITFDLSASPVVLNRSGNATFTIIYDFN